MTPGAVLRDRILLPLRRAELADVALGACVAVSLALCTLLVVHEASRSGSLVDVHSDHIHHSRATWTFLHRGFDVYRRPFRETAVSYPHFGVPWPDWPIVYPPGMFALFAPTTLLGAWVPMASETWAKLTILWIVLLSHVGLIGMWQALRQSKGGRAPILIAIWVLTLRMCLCGFYDAVWLGCAGMSIAACARKKPAVALGWLCAAVLLNYRAVSLAPVGVLAAVQLLSGPCSRLRRTAVLSLTAAVCGLVAWTFLLCSRVIPPVSEMTDRSTVSPFLPLGLRAVVLVGLCAAVAVTAFVRGDRLLAASVGWSALLTIVHAGPSWHGSMLVVTALLVGVGAKAGRRAVPVTFLRNVVVMWFLVVQEFAYNNTMPQLIEFVLRANLR